VSHEPCDQCTRRRDAGLRAVALSRAWHHKDHEAIGALWPGTVAEAYALIPEFMWILAGEVRILADEYGGDPDVIFDSVVNCLLAPFEPDKEH
jgi:hypothetical protein